MVFSLHQSSVHTLPLQSNQAWSRVWVGRAHGPLGPGAGAFEKWVSFVSTHEHVTLATEWLFVSFRYSLFAE